MSDYFQKFLVFKFSIEKKLEFELKSDSFPSTHKKLSFNWPLFSATLKEKKEIALKYSFQLSQTMVGFSFCTPFSVFDLFLRSVSNYLHNFANNCDSSNLIPGQCCAFNVMPEQIMLRDKKKHASQDDLKRWSTGAEKNSPKKWNN